MDCVNLYTCVLTAPGMSPIPYTGVNVPVFLCFLLRRFGGVFIAFLVVVPGVTNECNVLKRIKAYDINCEVKVVI